MCSFFSFFLIFYSYYKRGHVYILFFFIVITTSCPTVTNMQQDMDKLTFDLLEFDGKYKVFPINACAFMINMCGIEIPRDTVPTFNNLFGNRLGSISDFEAVSFYSDFTRLVTTHVMTPSLQNQLMGYFQISFTTDPAIDVMCAEAFQTSSIGTKTKTPYNTRKKSTKRSKQYNKPIMSLRCNDCDDNAIRFKLMKKMTTCSNEDLHKFNNFWYSLKSENALMATLFTNPRERQYPESRTRYTLSRTLRSRESFSA